MHILVIGTGYVGLVTGTCFAEMGHHVMCLDIDHEKIAKLRNGEIPIYEPGLQEIVRRNILSGRLQFTTEYAEAVQNFLVCFIAVGTPTGESGAADMTAVFAAVHEIAEMMDGYRVIVNKSTVPVGTGLAVREHVQEVLCERGVDFDFDVVSNPEFLKEGDAVSDFMKPDRVIIGVDNARSEKIMRELYSPFMFSRDRLFVMDMVSAEMAKYAANAMLASRVSFMNELSRICERVKADVTKVRIAIGSDSRIGLQFLYPGVGYGGSCFPKDIRALRATAQQYGVETVMLDAIEEVNREQKQVLGKLMSEYFTQCGGIENKTIAIWGLSFKPDTDDMRESSSVVLIEQLVTAGAYVRVFDPIAMENAQKYIPTSWDVTYCFSEIEAATGSDAIALVTEWKQFRFLDMEIIFSRMKGKAFFDGRNQYHPEEMSQIGFDYHSIGRVPIYATEEQLAVT